MTPDLPEPSAPPTPLAGSLPPAWRRGSWVVAILLDDSWRRARWGRRRPRLTRAAYDEANRLWDEHGPKNYNLDIEVTGNRPGKIHVEVRDGQAVHMLRDGVEPQQRRTWYYWTVPGMLDTIGQELDKVDDPEKGFGAPAGSQVILRAKFDRSSAFRRATRASWRGKTWTWAGRSLDSCPQRSSARRAKKHEKAATSEKETQGETQSKTEENRECNADELRTLRRDDTKRFHRRGRRETQRKSQMSRQ